MRRPSSRRPRALDVFFPQVYGGLGNAGADLLTRRPRGDRAVQSRLEGGESAGQFGAAKV